MKYEELSKKEQELYEEFAIDICNSIIKKGKLKKIPMLTGAIIGEEVDSAAVAMTIAWRKLK